MFEVLVVAPGEPPLPGAMTGLELSDRLGGWFQADVGAGALPGGGPSCMICGPPFTGVREQQQSLQH